MPIPLNLGTRIRTGYGIGMFRYSRLALALTSSTAILFLNLMVIQAPYWSCPNLPAEIVRVLDYELGSVATTSDVI